MADHPQTDVIIIGAGLAGLTCANRLVRRGLHVRVLEAADAVGGRIRTDHVDGMLLDRGFQVLNPAYPALRGVVDVGALDLRKFDRGVAVAHHGSISTLADPFRTPRAFASIAAGSTGSPAEKLRFASYVASTAIGSASHLKRRPDFSWSEALDRAHVQGSLRTGVLDPFLSGVLGEIDGSSSRVFVDLLLRAFARGTPGVPTSGMQALPDQLAASLPSDVIRLGVRATAIDKTNVLTVDGVFSAHAVVVATDGPAFVRLTGSAQPPQRQLTTFYHRADSSPARSALIHVDGDRSGPIVNCAVMSDIAPSYCADGALVASTIVGANDTREIREAVEGQLSRIYGVDRSQLSLVATYVIRNALPAMLPGLQLRQPVALGDALFVAGDHRDTASIQGAIVSGRRAATAVGRYLGLDRSLKHAS